MEKKGKMMPGGQLRKITLLGSSSGRNAGDAALMAAIMDDVDRACGRKLTYEIPTIAPAYIRRYYPNDALPLGMMPWQLSVKMLGLPTIRSVMRTDLTIIFDAILFDRSLYNPLFNFLSTLYLLLPFAARRGKRIVGYDIGAGPVHTPAGRHMLQTVGSLMTWATARDQESMDLLKDVGVPMKHLRLTADAALNAPSAGDAEADRVLRAAGLDPTEELFGINVNKYLDTWASPGRVSIGREAFLRVFAEALDRVTAETRAPLAFITTQYHDIAITKELMARLRPGTRMGLVTNLEHGHVVTKGVLRRLAFLCGMRLHACIMATSELTPTFGLNYQPKVSYFFNSALQKPEWCLSFDDYSTDQLAAFMLAGWRERASLRAYLERIMPGLRTQASRASGLVAMMDRGEDPRPELISWP